MLKFLLNKALVSVCKIKLKDQVSPLNYYDWIRSTFSVSGQNFSHLKENAGCPASPYFVSLITYLIGRLVSHLCNEFVQNKMTNSKRLKFRMWTFTSLWAYIRARYIYILQLFVLCKNDVHLLQKAYSSHNSAYKARFILVKKESLVFHLKLFS